LHETEQIITVGTVILASKENTSGMKSFIAVGTGYMRSEELPCRGRLLLYDIIEVVPEPGKPQTNRKLKQVFVSEEKHPVSAICAVNGYLLATVGTKIIMYEREDTELNGVAFLDVNIFVVSMSSVKNFILISDIYRSVWFAVFQEDPPKIILLGKDLYPVHVIGSEFIIGDSDLGLLVSDDKSNLHVMSYEPYSVQSQNGERLLRRGEMNLGYEIQSFAPLRLRPSLINEEYLPSKSSGVIAGCVH
jgi:cleavage and polyadenylation specificity factor subunit 1